MLPLWFRWSAAALLLTLTVGAVIRYRRANPPLVPQLVRICGNIPYDDDVIGFLDSHRVLVRKKRPSYDLYCVDTRTDRRRALDAINRRVDSFRRERRMAPEDMRSCTVSPDGGWIFYRVGDRHGPKLWAAVATDGSKIVTWPRDERWYLDDLTWKPDSSGLRCLAFRDRRYYAQEFLLNRPGKVVSRALPVGYSRPDDGLASLNLRAEIVGRKLDLYIYDPDRPEATPREVTVPRPGMQPDCEHAVVIWLEKDRDMAIYTPFGCPPVSNVVQELCSKLSIPDDFSPVLKRWQRLYQFEVWDLGLSSGRQQLLGRHIGVPEGDTFPKFAPALPDGRLGFQYRDGYYALPLPEPLPKGAEGSDDA